MIQFFKRSDVTSPEVITIAVKPYEVLLSFNDKAQAEAYLTWTYNKGLKEFEKWCDKFGHKLYENEGDDNG